MTISLKMSGRNVLLNPLRSVASPHVIPCHKKEVINQIAAAFSVTANRRLCEAMRNPTR